jgi:hypothetical protein
MVRYFQAGTNIVGLPKNMVFLDKSGGQHLYPSLTPKHHIASHYGTSAIETAYNTKAGNLLKIKKGTYTNYKEKVKKQQKAVKELVKANLAVETAAKKMRGRPRKNATVAAAAPVMAVIPKRTRTRLTPEQKALKAQQKADKKALKAQKKADKEQMKANKAQIKADKALAKELAKAQKPKKKAKME